MKSRELPEYPKPQFSRSKPKAEGVSDATRKRIQELLDRMGYQVSPVFSAGTNAKTKTIGLIVPDITNPFFQDW